MNTRIYLEIRHYNGLTSSSTAPSGFEHAFAVTIAFLIVVLAVTILSATFAF